MSIWHHGLVAEWWAHFNTDGPEIEYYGERIQEPVLDAGCGAGRLLLPWLRAGIDVDGCDASPDMIALAHDRAAVEGLHAVLFAQPLHCLDPPRCYRSIVVCGAFGLGTTRTQDREGLRRLHSALQPGGLLLLDNEVPYSSPRRWCRWTEEGRSDLPAPWPDEPTRKRAVDGSEYALWTRTVDVDPLDQCVYLSIRVEKRLNDRLVGEEQRDLSMRMYFRDELALELERAGFSDVKVEAGYTGGEPTAADDFLVFLARG